MVGQLEIREVTKLFPKAGESGVLALNGVSLNIHSGSFVSFIGPSGCGKSTLLRLIAGLDSPTKGEICLDGVKITKPGSERGLVFQDPTLFPWLNIHDNIAFGLKARGVYKQERDSVAQFIKMVGLEGFEKSYPHQLSGGMCQRASLARALIGHPTVLLLDEPLGALDAFTRMNMQDEILRIRREQSMTMVMVTHDVDEAVYLSDEIVVMSPRPAKIEGIIQVPLTHPRDRNNSEFVRLRGKILKILHYAGREKEPEYYI
ncbi:MAG: ABC transporter ATP-binding protein [Oscillospiraceae bacterium]|nr:ABC transporter ATP-binding protein [Oscillospiraceae bacterium]MCD8099574.1 ABC transporter ATP-binding protein [Oscillospiraceae bacterium]